MDERDQLENDKLKKILKAILKNPRLILLAIYWISGIAAFFLCPDGIALYVGGGVADNFISTFIYVPVVGIFVTAFSILSPKHWRKEVHHDHDDDSPRPSMFKTWIGMIIMMIIHFFLLINSIP